jgi:cytosine/adenosine deaminase-related metal-dependent hydrolase
MHGTVLRGGRVIDPESGFDAVADVLIADGRILAVGQTSEAVDSRTVDISGQVVAPGFIDVHSHSHSLAGRRLQLLDGVTTALELEVGLLPVAGAYRRAGNHPQPSHYGCSASWAVARMAVLAGLEPTGRIGEFFANLADPAWQRPATGSELSRILQLLEGELDDGAIGIGVAIGYAPDVEPAEYLAVAALAARRGVPAFTHARDLAEIRPGVAIDGATEIVRAALDTGAQLHFCHIHSTSTRWLERVLTLVGGAQAAGARLTTEAYPYGAGMTGIGASFISPAGLRARGLDVTALTYAPTGERIASFDRLAELRALDPGALVIMDNLREELPAEHRLLMQALSFPDGLIASDAMPLVSLADPAGWPLSAEARTHPRTAGTFSKALRILHRDAQLPLVEVIRRATLLPARLLEPSVPAMRRKGRVQAGCDADLVVFDPVTVSDQATYDASTRSPTGINQVLVGGEFAVRNGVLRPWVNLGRPLRSASGG